MAAGRVTAAQARAIVRALDLLPATGRFATTADQRATAEAHLVDLAADFDATALEQLGRRIHAVICPDHVDAYEGTLLEAEEAHAARRTSLQMWHDHHGTCHGRFRIPRLHGHILKKALESLTNPTRVSTGLTSEPIEPVETTPTKPVEPVETTPSPGPTADPPT